MSQPTRHVRTVRLNAPNTGLICRGAILLEDALHTASMPGTEGGRLLIVRSLNIGTIDTHDSSATLALTLEKRLWQLNAIAIHAEDDAAYTAPVVYFQDDAEPYICLATRLARQVTTDAWFWSLAVPEWQPNLPRDEALRRLLRGVIQTRSGVTAAVALMSELLLKQAIAPLLATLRYQDGLDLLQVCGWNPPDLAISLIEPLTPEPMQQTPWSALLAAWIEQWGALDARSVWLAAIALISENPTRILNPKLSDRTAQFIKQVYLTTRSEIEFQTNNSNPLNLSDRNSSITRQKSRHKLKLMAHISSPIKRTKYRFPFRFSELGLKQRKLIFGQVRRLKKNAAIPHLKPIENSLVEPKYLIENHEVDDYKNRSESPIPTNYAGLFFLVTLLNHLGIATFLESHPHLIELDLPRRLLHAVMQRLSIPCDDPVWEAIANLEEPSVISNYEFIAPKNWQQGVWQTGVWTIRRSANELNTKVLFDKSGKLVLALWRGKAGGELRSLIGEHPLTQGSPAVIASHLTVLLSAWITAMRRWCRRYAQMGLHDLVCRPGRILITRTHIDILFHHQQADIRIRRVGLDLDPGWVPWFGRVVAFHYLDREEVYEVE